MTISAHAVPRAACRRDPGRRVDAAAQRPRRACSGSRLRPVPRLREDAGRSIVGPYGLTGGAIALAATERAAAPNLNVDYSTTNVQEAGVDEPDIVKTDGEKIVALAEGSYTWSRSKAGSRGWSRRVPGRRPVPDRTPALPRPGGRHLATAALLSRGPAAPGRSCPCRRRASSPTSTRQPRGRASCARSPRGHVRGREARGLEPPRRVHVAARDRARATLRPGKAG